MTRIPFRLCALLWLAGLCPLQGVLPDGYETIYLNRHASPEVATAAAELAALLAKTYGQSPHIRRDPFMLISKGIHIGPDSRNPAFDDDPLTDEILIERTRRGLEIRGSDNTSAQFAIFRFAEEFLGWRYYQPGPIGLERLDDAPAPPEIDGTPEILHLSRADYISRNPYSLDPVRAGLPDWRTWHGLRERFQYNHTLHRVIPPTRFDTHPAWFAKDASGKPMRPPYYPRVHGYNDHPDLSQPEVREFVAKETLKAIEEASPFSGSGTDISGERSGFPHILQTPGALSVSLSLGDSFVFGEFPESYPWRPDHTFRRWPDWSNHVFAYTNAVAARIYRQWNEGRWSGGAKPDLFLGALAYLNWEDVPDFPLHPAIVPYLTFDRSQWYDPEARSDDLANVAAWNRTSAPFLGTWDYLFGYGFIIPRSMTHIVAESIPALHERGVRAYFSQIAAIWPYDGHTNWLLTRLLWDTGADADSLLEEYFREFYGPAAPSMRAFFDHAESIWMNQGGSGWWLRHWKDPWQVALYGQADLEKMERLLETAAQEAARFGATRPDSGLSISRFSERVRQTRLMFDLTRALFTYQKAVWDAQTGPMAGALDPDIHLRQGLFESVLDSREALLQARDTVVQSLPNASRARDLEWVFRYETTGGALATFCLAYPDLPGNAGLLERWARLQGFTASPAVAGGAEEILYDNAIVHFGDARIWHRQFMDSEGIQVGSIPEGGIAVENVRRGFTYQLFRASPGNVYLGEVDVRTRQSPSGEVTIKIDFFDADHNLISESPRARIAPTGQYGVQQQIRALAQAPAEAAYGRLFVRFYEMDPGSRAEVTRAAVFRLDSVPTP
jgi:hypothetical protein